MHTHQRESVKCRRCETTQFRTEAGKCRRCGAPLLRGSVETTTVILVREKTPPPPTPIIDESEVVPLRETMRNAVVQAVKAVGPVKAAQKLGIPHGRLKQLLREAGVSVDFRKEPKRRKTK